MKWVFVVGSFTLVKLDSFSVFLCACFFHGIFHFWMPSLQPLDPINIQLKTHFIETEILRNNSIWTSSCVKFALMDYILLFYAEKWKRKRKLNGRRSIERIVLPLSLDLIQVSHEHVWFALVDKKWYANHLSSHRFLVSIYLTIYLFQQHNLCICTVCLVGKSFWLIIK